MKSPIFIISLDFELHWGGVDKWPLENYRQYFLNTRVVIPELLDLFRQHSLHVTWATVGMLFHQSKFSLLQHSPKLIPTYKSLELSAYHYIERYDIGESEKTDPFHFAASIIHEIINTPFQELSSHTFAHYYCNEPGQTIEQFTADLQAAQTSAAIFGKKLTSLVFPRNQFNDEYLMACSTEGFKAVRENPRDWFWNIQSTHRESKWKRLNRGLDAYLPVGKKTTYPVSSITHRPGLPVCIPASRLLRPYRRIEFFLNGLKISRIKKEMTCAAKRGEVYHLWWHPHNFGHYPKENMKGLKEILNHFCFCREQFGMKSLSMGEVADLVVENRA